MQSEKQIRPYDFRKARRIIENKDKSMRVKLMNLDEAIRSFVMDGDHLAIGGSLYTRAPMASLHEILRQKKNGLVLSRGLIGFEADLLVVGCGVKKIVSSWWSPGYAWGMSKVMRDFVESGRLEFEEWSHSTIGLRYRAGAMGTSFLPTMSLQGSDLQKVNDVREIDCPFTGAKIPVVPALYPDVAIIHAHRADKFGNVQIDGYPFMDQDIARASSRLIVTAEEIVDTDLFRIAPERTIIPFFCVDAVVTAPYGAYPGECWNLYEADFEHFDHYSALVNKEGIDGVKRYLDEVVYSTGTFSDLLARVGMERLNERRRAFKDVAS